MTNPTIKELRELCEKLKEMPWNDVEFNSAAKKSLPLLLDEVEHLRCALNIHNPKCETECAWCEALSESLERLP